jgi:hypothetical protein
MCFVIYHFYQSLCEFHTMLEYSGASVHELNPFLVAVLEPKCS